MTIVDISGVIIFTLIFFFLFYKKAQKSYGPTFQDIIEIELKKHDLEFVTSKNVPHKSKIKFSLGKLQLGGFITRRYYERSVTFIDLKGKKRISECTVTLTIINKHELKFSPELSNFK